jgi:hypothetical protein
MMRANTLSVIVPLLFAAASPSMAADAPYNAAQRQAQIERVRDGLNSPDPTKRLITLEQAVAAKDATIRRVALSTAFASSDGDLRSAALVAAIGSAATFAVDITGADKSGNNGRTSALQGLGPSFEVRVQQFDRSSETFKASTSASAWNGKVRWMPGSVSGDRLTFEINTSRLYHSDDVGCSGVARLQGGTTHLVGTMTCLVLFGEKENYTIAIDVPK